MDTYQSSSVILRRQRELCSHTTAIFASIKCNAFHRGIVSRKECVYSHLLYHGVPVIFPQCLPLNSDFAATAPPPPGAAPSTCRWLRKAVFVLLLDVFFVFNLTSHLSPSLSPTISSVNSISYELYLNILHYCSVFPTEHNHLGATGLTGRRVVCFDP